LLDLRKLGADAVDEGLASIEILEGWSHGKDYFEPLIRR
jgi:hypothetical protein